MAKKGFPDIYMEKINQREGVSIKKNDHLIGKLKKAHFKIKREEALFTGTNFFSDASILKRYGDVSTVLYGPGESGEAHKPNESVQLSNFYDSILVFYEFIRSYN